MTLGFLDTWYAVKVDIPFSFGLGSSGQLTSISWYYCGWSRFAAWGSFLFRALIGSYQTQVRQILMTRQFILATTLRIWTIISSEKLHLDDGAHQTWSLCKKNSFVENGSSFNTSNEIWFSCQPQHPDSKFKLRSFLPIHLGHKRMLNFDYFRCCHAFALTLVFFEESISASINFCCCLQAPMIIHH